jgi:hypothetical protein
VFIPSYYLSCFSFFLLAFPLLSFVCPFSLLFVISLFRSSFPSFVRPFPLSFVLSLFRSSFRSFVRPFPLSFFFFPSLFVFFPSSISHSFPPSYPLPAHHAHPSFPRLYQRHKPPNPPSRHTALSGSPTTTQPAPSSPAASSPRASTSCGAKAPHIPLCTTRPKPSQHQNGPSMKTTPSASASSGTAA